MDECKIKFFINHLCKQLRNSVRSYNFMAILWKMSMEFDWLNHRLDHG